MFPLRLLRVSLTRVYNYRQNLVRRYSDPLQIAKVLTMDKVSRKEKKEKKRIEKDNTAPSNVLLSVLGNGSDGNPRALLLFTEFGSYLFNCGEGTQRMSHDHGYKISKCLNLFFTSNKSENFGGLLGYLMTTNNLGLSNLNLHAPPGLIELFKISSEFTYADNFSLNQTSHIKEDTTYDDRVMHIDMIPIKLDANQPYEESDHLTNEEINCENKKEMTNLISSNPSAMKKKKEIVVTYICTLKEKAGTLNLFKCLNLKVPRGPLLGLLKAGKDITLDDGTVVRSKDVCDDNELGGSFIVLECPSIEYLEPIVVNNKIWAAIEKKDNPCKLIAHFSPKEVIESEAYQSWLRTMPPTVKHWFLTKGNSKFSLVGATLQQDVLHKIDPVIFPQLHVDKHLQTQEAIDADRDATYVYPRVNRAYKFRPLNKQIELTSEIVCMGDGYFEKCSTPTCLESVKKEYIASTKHIQGKEYPNAIFLGTGSAIPSRRRNASAILININENASTLFDCGEGTFGQILRFLGPEKIKVFFRNLHTIFISHIHADHQLGLIHLLLKREEYLGKKIASENPVRVFGPSRLAMFILQYARKFDEVGHLLTFYGTPIKDTIVVPENLLKDSGIQRMEIVRVKHCFNSCGVTIQTDPDETGRSYKIVYSGDALPSKLLVETGMNADLLIHEATFSKAYERDAILKQHSTTGQAIRIGKDMNARHILLTHFSQRFKRMPIIDEDFTENVGFSFDNMQIRFSELDKLPHLAKAANNMFTEETEDELRFEKYKRKSVEHLIFKSDRKDSIEEQVDKFLKSREESKSKKIRLESDK